mgnify:CR=1 FL=1
MSRNSAAASGVAAAPAGATPAAAAGATTLNLPGGPMDLTPDHMENGRWYNAEGIPTFKIEDGKLDYASFSGYRRYHAECHVCHGPDGMGSTYAPALKDSLKHLGYEEFIGILAGGKQDVNAAEQKVMPAFGDNKNVMCYSDDLYVYLKARAAGAIGRIRPSEHEDKPDSAKKAEKEQNEATKQGSAPPTASTATAEATSSWWPSSDRAGSRSSSSRFQRPSPSAL